MLNKFLLKGREVMGRMRGRKKGGEEERRQAVREEARGNRMEAGRAPVPCLQYLPGKSLHLVSCTAAEAQLCVYSLITPHAAQRPRAGLELAHSPSTWVLESLHPLTSSPRLRQGSVSKN